MKPMKKYRAAIFDMDGTIVDSRSFHASVFEAFFRENWRDVGYVACYEAVGVTVRSVYDSVGIPAEKHPECFGLLGSYYQRDAETLLKRTSLADGAVTTLRYMRDAGMATAIVTNSHSAAMDLFMDYHGLRSLFDEVLGAIPHSLSKHQRCKMLEEKFGVCARDVLYIGDSENDMILANDMGYDACFMNTPIAWYEDEAYIVDVLRPKYTFASYEALLQLLKG